MTDPVRPRPEAIEVEEPSMIGAGGGGSSPLPDEAARLDALHSWAADQFALDPPTIRSNAIWLLELVDSLRQQLAEANEKAQKWHRAWLDETKDCDEAIARAEEAEATLAEAETEIVQLCNARDDAEGRALDAKARVAEAEAERDRLKDALQAFCSPSAWREIKTRVDVALLAPTQTEQTP